ncbi:hypothetical protein JN531_008270 [Flagellatimonas centrodinii]|uniref:heme biosynthesis HemY N-terminal domain-containing protein n=1 Tax=Flagellatimonas centrodinii TaxID=2806210 RepID=UPI001FEFCE0D|nr:heme biosynthesis HemY N-terminal domain-containing protein [Flagellatimonas centrodinii]ULQ45121.1 hypothetical protein JN531_008270 [Flagellatimonas centrodinii]
MIVLLLLALLALTLGGAAAYTFRSESGYVLFAWQDWTVETSLPGFVLLVLVSVVGLYLGWRLLSGAVGLPGRMQAYLAHRRRQRAQDTLIAGLRHLAAGDFRRAEIELLRRVADHPAADINYLAAAQAAHQLRAGERRDHYLALAAQAQGPDSPAVLSVQASLQRAAGQGQAALETARHFHQRHPRHPHAVRLYARALAAAGESSVLLNLLQSQGEAVPEAQRQAWQAQALGTLLRVAAGAGQLDQLKATWASAGASVQALPAAQRAYAEGLVQLGAEADAAAVIGRALKHGWDEPLVRLFGGLDSLDPVSQLATLEQWLQQHGEQTALLLACGRACMRNHLWGKASSYLEAALRLHPVPAVYLLLAQLAERTQRPEDAQRHYREGLTRAANMRTGD